MTRTVLKDDNNRFRFRSALRLSPSQGDFPTGLGIPRHLAFCGLATDMMATISASNSQKKMLLFRRVRGHVSHVMRETYCKRNAGNHAPNAFKTQPMIYFVAPEQGRQHQLARMISASYPLLQMYSNSSSGVDKMRGASGMPSSPLRPEMVRTC